jgi:sterol desaturase/sphingolipid hydroxylase (fatty acid hydroxylase superfamily)
MQEIFHTLIVFACCFLAQYLFPSIKNQRPWRQDSLIDLEYWFLSSYILIYIAAAILAVFGKITTLDSNLTSLGYTYMDVALCLVVIDFIGYWVHRLYHSNRLWAFHSIHHSPKELDFLSATRFHPLENLNIILVQFIVAVYVLGFDLKAYALATGIRGMYGFFVHSNLKWNLGKAGYIFSNPYFHRWHHTMEQEGLDKNFGGVFSAWDFIFGTSYLPKNLQPYNFGVPDDVGKNIWRQFVYPFEKIWGKKTKML